jgi:sulfatase modifying factor 1
LSARISVLGLVALALGCGGVELGLAPDAGTDGDVFDARVPIDAATGDARANDASTSGDASVELDASNACMVGALMGECLDVARCTGDRMPVAGHCPGPSSIQCCVDTTASDCDPTVHVQPNEGIAGEAAGEGGCPSGMIPVTSAFCVDRYEASLVEVLGDGTTTEWSPFFNPGTTRVRALSRAGAVPQGYISGVQAESACEEAGKRLCTDTEWLRACQGSMGVTYPYSTSAASDVRMTGVCNDHRDVHPAVERFGTSDAWIYSMLDDACISQLPMSLARTGAYDGCISEPGAFDMMGNLHEWTSDPAGTFRGGFYVDTVLNGPGCLYRTTAHDVSHHDYSTGFRCCADL